MREILTGIALFLIVVLLAAMAGPYFINWNGQRARIESELSTRLGMPVRIDGDIRILLLPTPTLRAGSVRLAGKDDPVSVSVDGLSLFLSPQSLLQGKLHITQMDLDSPKLMLDENLLAEQPARTLALDIDLLKKVSIEKLTINNGSVQTSGAAGPPFLEGLSATVNAPSLAGPIRGNGTFQFAGHVPAFRFSTGEASKDRILVDLLVEDPGAGLKLETQGHVRFADSEEGKAGSFEGTVSSSGSISLGLATNAAGLPWRATAKLSASPGIAKLSDLTVNFSQKPTEVTFKGHVDMNSTAGTINATLAARQIDADRLFGIGEPRRVTPVALVSRLQDILQSVMAASTADDGNASTLGAMKVTLGLSTEAMLIGGDQLTGGKVQLSMENGSATIESAAANLPLGTKLSFVGQASGESGLGGGAVSLSIPDLPGFEGWATQRRPQRGGLESIDLKGDAVWDDVRLQIQDAAFITNGMSWSGRIGWLPPDPSTHPQGLIELDLAAPYIDLDRLPIRSFTASGAGALPGFDINLSIGTLAFNGGSFGKVTFDAESIGDRLTVKDLRVDDFGGASFTASGELSPLSDAIEGTLKASDLTTLAQLVDKVSPGALSRWFVKSAGPMSPAEVKVSLTSSMDERSESRNRSLTIDGTLARTKARISGLWRESVGPGGSPTEPSSLGISLDAEQASVLLAQLGMSNDVGQIGPASVLANVRGSIASGFDIEAATESTIGRGSLSGRIVLTAPSYPLTGKLTLNAYDLGILSEATGVDRGFLPPGRTAFVTGTLYGSLNKVLLAEMTAEVADSTYRGEIAFNLAKGGKVAGQLRVDRLDLSPVLGIPFGRWPERKPGELWASTRFGPSDPPVLEGDLWIEAEEMALSENLPLSGARFILRFAKGLLNFEQADARYAGGRIAGEVFFRRAEDSVQLSSNLKLTDLAINRLAPIGADARISGSVQASAIGLSPASLVASLAGGGSLTITNVILDALDVSALDRVAREGLETFADKGSEALATRFEQELTKAPFRAGRIDTPLAMAGGTLRLGPAVKQQDGVSLEATGSANLKDSRIEARLAMTSETRIEDIGETPQAAISWSGTPDALSRRTDFGAFTAAVTERAIEIEQQKTEAFEEDLRERAMFNRRLKADRAQLSAEREARLQAERDAAISREGERIRLHFERIQLEATARRERAQALQEFVLETNRARARSSPVADQASGQTAGRQRARSLTTQDLPLELVPDAGRPIDLSPPQPTQ